MRESFTTSATRSESILSARAESLVAEIHFTVSPITAFSSFKNPSAVPVQVSALPRALVGAVDSLVDAASLETHVGARLYLGRRNPDGRIPGEAAGFVALARPGAPKSLKLEATGVLLGTALATESKPFSQRVPSEADGLTAVLHALRRDAVTGARRVDAVFACQPGDSFWGSEFALASLRNAALMPEPLRVHLAGEGLGDAGAGADPVMLGMALHRARWRQPGARRTLVYGSADGGRIGACVVEMIRSAKEAA
jgi:3-oxoacyl-[acyl-carrier-protein] synthase-1